MLFLYFMVGVALAIPEVIFVQHIPFLKRITEKSPIVEIVFSLAFGMIISLAMGIEGGVTFAVANVFSTMITKAVYGWHIMDKMESFKVWRKEAKITTIRTYHHVRACLRAMKIILKIIFFPVVAINRLLSK